MTPYLEELVSLSRFNPIIGLSKSDINTIKGTYLSMYHHGLQEEEKPGQTVYYDESASIVSIPTFKDMDSTLR